MDRRGCWIAAIGLSLTAACRGPAQSDAARARDAPPNYLSDQAAGMAAEDADRAGGPTTRPRRPQSLRPTGITPRSPVDQPRIR